MSRFYTLVALAMITVASAFFTDSANAQQDWYPYVIARGQDRTLIQSLPIEQRPNRPLHIYGNTVRRSMNVRTETVVPRLNRLTILGRRR